MISSVVGWSDGLQMWKYSLSLVLGWCIIYRSWKCMVCLCEFKKHMWCWRCQECQETMEDPRRSFSLGHLQFTRHIAHHQRKKHQLHIFADTGYISGNCAREWVWLDVSSKTLTLRTSGYPQGLRLKNGNDSFYIMWIKKDIPVCVLVLWYPLCLCLPEGSQLCWSCRTSRKRCTYHLETTGLWRWETSVEMGNQQAGWQHGSSNVCFFVSKQRK